MQPLEQGDQRGLAASARPHQGHRLPRQDRQLDAPEHGGAHLIREAHLLEQHLAAERRYVGRVGPVTDGVLRVENAVDALQADGGAPEGLIGVREPLDRTEQAADVAEKGNQRPHAELPLERQPAAQRQRTQPGGGGGQIPERAVPAVGAHATAHELVSLPYSLEEPSLLGVLHSEALHRHHAGEHLVEPPVDRAPPFHQPPLAPDLLRRRAGPDERRQRGEDDHRRGEPPVEAEHGEHAEAQVEHRGQQVEGEVAERGDVTADALVDPVHRAAHALPLVVGQRERIELADHALPHGVLHGEPHVPAPAPEPPLEQRPNQLEPKQPGDGHGEVVAPVRPRELVEEVLHDERVDGAQRGEDEREPEYRCQASAVRTDELQRSEGQIRARTGHWRWWMVVRRGRARAAGSSVLQTEQVQCPQLHAGRAGAGESAASSGKIRVHSA